MAALRKAIAAQLNNRYLVWHLDTLSSDTLILKPRYPGSGIQSVPSNTATWIFKSWYTRSRQLGNIEQTPPRN